MLTVFLKIRTWLYTKPTWWLLVLVLPIIVTAVKVTLVPITNDEAYSWQLVQQNYWQAMLGTANTHWLTTLFLWFSKPFGSSLWAIRWFSFICFIAYVAGIFWLSRKQFTGVFQFLFFCLLTMHPYIIDYACLARGYVPSLAFLVWLIIAVQYSKKVWLVCLLAVLTLFASYSSLFVVIAIMVLFFVGKRPTKQAIQPILFLVGAVVFAVVNLLFIQSQGDLVLGSQNGFVAGSLYSLVYEWLYLPTQVTLPSISLIWLDGILLALLVFGYTKKEPKLRFLSGVLGICVLLHLVAYMVGKVAFPMQRAVLIYWLPVLWLIFELAANSFKKTSSGLRNSLATLALLFFMVTIVSKTQLQRCKDWLPDAAMPAILKDMATIKSYNPNATVAINHVQYGAWFNYYRFLPKYGSLPKLTPIDLSGYPLCSLAAKNKLMDYDYLYLCNRMPVTQFPFFYKEVKPIGSLGDTRLQLR